MSETREQLATKIVIRCNTNQSLGKLGPETAEEIAEMLAAYEAGRAAQPMTPYQELDAKFGPKDRVRPVATPGQCPTFREALKDS